MADGAQAADIRTLAPRDVVVLAPHADDETLGCGMAIHAALRAGRSVTVVLVTDGTASHRASRTHPPAVMARLRRAEFEAAVSRLGAGRIATRCLDLKDAGLRPDAASRDAILDGLADLSPGVVWATWGGDPHCDHQATALAARALARRHGVAHWSYAVWGRFGRRPLPCRRAVRRFGCARAVDAKRHAARCYRSQLTRMVRDDPDAFTMPGALTRHFLDTPEIFIREVP